MAPKQRYEPVLLLFAFGAAMASIIALAKGTLEAGVPPVTLAFQQITLGAVMLAVAGLASNRPVQIGWRAVPFLLIGGLLGIALPHALLFLTVPHLGAGLSSVVYVFPPLFTYALALAIRMERFHIARCTGLALGLVGSVFIVFRPDTLPPGVSPVWMVVAYLIPLSMAAGNIYRSLFWRGELNGLSMTTGILAASALLLIPLVVIDPINRAALIPTADLLLPVLCQGALTGLGYMAFFRLQSVGGPVYLSQSGYVITAIGMAYGLFLFGEVFGAALWFGLCLNLAGILLVTLSQLRGFR